MTVWCIDLAEQDRVRTLEFIDAIAAAHAIGRPTTGPSRRRSVPKAMTGIDIDGRDHAAKFSGLEDGFRLTIYASASGLRRLFSITDTRPGVRAGDNGCEQTALLLSAWRQGLASPTTAAALQKDRQNSQSLAEILAAALVNVGVPSGVAHLWQAGRGPGLLITVTGDDAQGGLRLFGSRQGSEHHGGISLALLSLFNEGMGRVAHILPGSFVKKARRGMERPLSITIGRHPLMRADLPENVVERLRVLARPGPSGRRRPDREGGAMSANSTAAPPDAGGRPTPGNEFERN